jgi:GNAT superfamily N-acetyltransferase
VAAGGPGVELTVRDAGPDDAPAVAELLGELGYPISPREAAARLGRQGERVLLAELDGRVQGLVALSVGSLIQHARPLARVTALVVRESARGRGAGRRLMARAEELARAAGCAGVELTSGLRAEREAAHRFYEALGYVRTSHRFWRPLDGQGTPSPPEGEGQAPPPFGLLGTPGGGDDS